MADGEPTRPGGAAGAGPGARPAARGAGLVRFAVRALIAAGAGVMGAGFLGWRAGVLVAGLTALSYVLLALAAPRITAPYGRGRLLRRLQAGGYRLTADAAGRHLAIGPGGAFLLDTRWSRNAVQRGSGGWLIGGRPAERVVDRIATAAVRAGRTLGLEGAAGVVPVIVVTGRLPEPVMRADRAVIARPRAAARFVLERPEALEPGTVAALTALARRR